MAEEFEVTSVELEDRVRTNWILETYQRVHLVDENGEPVPDPAGEEVPWMISSSHYDDRDRAVSTLAFRERKYPDDRNRITRIEVRHYVEEISDEELKKWHDRAAKGDEIKKAMQG